MSEFGTPPEMIPNTAPAEIDKVIRCERVDVCKRVWYICEITGQWRRTSKDSARCVAMAAFDCAPGEAKRILQYCHDHPYTCVAVHRTLIRESRGVIDVWPI